MSDILTQVNLLLDESAAGSMLEANARLDQILDPGPDRLLDPQFTLLRLCSALLGRLLEHRDYEAWAEEDCDATDGLLREIADQAQALRPCMVAGLPDPPAGTETWARAQQLIADDPDHARCYRLAAATVQAFEDAGLTDGAHFLGLIGHVWGFTADDDYGVRLPD